MQIFLRGMNNRMANLANFHTSAASSVHLISTSVPLSCGQLLKLTSDVVGRPEVGVPIGVDAIRGGCQCFRPATYQGEYPR
jgi:hypothetical protein